MESAVTALKIDLLLNIQLNKYDESSALAEKIIAMSPNDALILKFANFLRIHKAQMKEMDEEETKQPPVEVQNCDDQGSEWESDCDSDFSISNSDEDEEQSEAPPIKKQELHTRDCCPKVKQTNIPQPPAKPQKAPQIKKSQPKPQPPTKTAPQKKTTQANQNTKGAAKAKC